MLDLKELGYIPLDKSWIIRMGMLDLTNNHSDILKFLRNTENLSDDLISLRKVAEDWNSASPLDVGESGTLYRFIKFFLWKTGNERTIVRNGTLTNREICNNPNVINMKLRELLTLDSQTSQWASASVLFGNKEILSNPPNKLKLTYEALSHWHERRAGNQNWLPRYDKTIERQALAFLNLLKTGNLSFVPQHSEDYCFARAFNLITAEEGEKMFPSLIGHESNRLEEMEMALKELKRNAVISSKDHRVIQAIAMFSEYQDPHNNLIVQNPKSVSKSWPQFWKFLKDSRELSNAP